jgi:hypothetical protein
VAADLLGLKVVASENLIVWSASVGSIRSVAQVELLREISNGVVAGFAWSALFCCRGKFIARFNCDGLVLSDSAEENFSPTRIGIEMPRFRYSKPTESEGASFLHRCITLASFGLTDQSVHLRILVLLK